MDLIPPRQQRYLFTDFRHIMCGDLEWRSPDGQAVPVAGPPQPPIEVTADPDWLTDGIRLLVQPATKTDPLPPGTPRGARVMYDGGVYRSWSIKADYPAGQDLGSYSHAQATVVTIIYTESSDGWACWPDGRLCAVTADQGGHFNTFYLQPAGRTLKLNLRTAAAGEVRVGLFDTPGRSLADCAPLHGDDHAITVHWHGQTDIGTPEGKPVILQFALRHAELFGFEWEA